MNTDIEVMLTAIYSGFLLTSVAVVGLALIAMGVYRIISFFYERNI